MEYRYIIYQKKERNKTKQFLIISALCRCKAFKKGPGHTGSVNFNTLL